MDRSLSQDGVGLRSLARSEERWVFFYFWGSKPSFHLMTITMTLKKVTKHHPSRFSYSGDIAQLSRCSHGFFFLVSILRAAVGLTVLFCFAFLFLVMVWWEVDVRWSFWRWKLSCSGRISNVLVEIYIRNDIHNSRYVFMQQRLFWHSCGGVGCRNEFAFFVLNRCFLIDVTAPNKNCYSFMGWPRRKCGLKTHSVHLTK